MASSVSAIFGLRMPSPAAAATVEKPKVEWSGVTTVECSSRPQKKGTKHHMKTRPKKTQAWDIKRKPTVYPKLMDLPREWTLVEAAEVVPVAEESVETAV